MKETKNRKSNKEILASPPGADISIVEYARCHSMMMLMMLIFFGVLIIPFCISKMRESTADSYDATVIQIFYSMSHPDMSLVSLRYTDKNDTTHVIRETIDKLVKVNDSLTIYVIPTKVADKSSYVFFHTPCHFIYYFLLLLFYVCLIAITLYMMTMHYYHHHS